MKRGSLIIMDSFKSEHFYFLKKDIGEGTIFADFNFSEFVVLFVIDLTKGSIATAPILSVDVQTGEEKEFDIGQAMESAYKKALENLNYEDVKECKTLCPITAQVFKVKILERGLFEDFMKKAKSWGEKDLEEHLKMIFN